MSQFVLCVYSSFAIPINIICINIIIFKSKYYLVYYNYFNLRVKSTNWWIQDSIMGKKEILYSLILYSDRVTLFTIFNVLISSSIISMKRYKYVLLNNIFKYIL